MGARSRRGASFRRRWSDSGGEPAKGGTTWFRTRGLVCGVPPSTDSKMLPMNTPKVISRVLAALWLVIPAVGQSTGVVPGFPQADYLMTNTHRSVTNFNVETTRGLCWLDEDRLLMINTHGSQLVLATWQGLGPEPAVERWATLNNPVAVAAYGDFAVVLGGGSHAIAVQDLSTGRIVSTLQLSAEPGDLVIDEDNRRGFASVPGNNTVVAFELQGDGFGGEPRLILLGEKEIPSQRPRFLALDPSRPGSVLVVPELSGNGTASSNAVMVDDPKHEQGQDGALSAIEPDHYAFPKRISSLPDEDMFRLSVSENLEVELEDQAVGVGLGTLLFGVGRHPQTGELWVLNCDSRNLPEGFVGDEPTLEELNEPKLKGTFSRNCVTIFSEDGEREVLYLDGDGGDTNPVSLPWSLSFDDSASARGIITGSASDRVRVLNSDGMTVQDLDLPEGSIPRGASVAVGGDRLAVYCWGTNMVRLYAYDTEAARPIGMHIEHLDLGVDPTPEFVRMGREIFYDADRSFNGNTTCGHCHPGGGMDLLGWNIADFPHDRKDLMVTQSLKSIEDTFPYHWRGERDFEAFNGAFTGLLGADAALDEEEGGELEQFKAFVFSLQVHANPLQGLDRVLDPDLSRVQSSYFPEEGGLHGPGDPLRGLVLMDRPDTLGRFSCADCHGLPAGTVGETSVDDARLLPTNMRMDTAHFRQLFHKEQVIVGGEGDEAGLLFPRGGYGFSHDGGAASIFDFLDRNPFKNLSKQDRRDLAAFIQQVDEGISPAAHRVWQVDENTPQETVDELVRVITNQAGQELSENEWISMTVVGELRDDGNSPWTPYRWAHSNGLFICSDANLVVEPGQAGEQSLQDLLRKATEGDARLIFLGLPPGNAWRFALDRDDDGQLDAVDEAPETPMIVGVEGPPKLLSARIDHMGATYAKLVLEFSEPVTYEVWARDPVKNHVVVERRNAISRFDTVTVQRLMPSLPAVQLPGVMSEPVATSYEFRVRMKDLDGVEGVNYLQVSGTTRDQLVDRPFPAILSILAPPSSGPGEPVPLPAPLLARTVDEVTVNEIDNGQTLEVKVVLGLRFDSMELGDLYGGETAPNKAGTPLDRQTVLAQLLVDSGEGLAPCSVEGLTLDEGPLLILPFLSDPDSPTGSPVVPIKDIYPEGALLLSEPSGPGGEAVFHINTSGIPSGAREVRLNILAILEEPAGLWTADYKEFSSKEHLQDQDLLEDLLPDNQGLGYFNLISIASYDMPATAPEHRSIVLWTQQ